MSPSAHGSERDEQATREMPRVEAGAGAAGGSVAGAAGTAAAGAGPDVGGAAAGSGYTGPMPSTSAPLPDRDPFAERPEYYVGAAFVGGLLAAQILKRFGR